MQQNNENILKYQVLGQQLQTLEQQTELIHKQLEELQELQRALEEFKHQEKGSTMLANIGPGMYVEAQLMNTEHIHMSIGAGVMAKKTLDEAKAITAQQVRDLEQVDRELHQQIEKLIKEVQELQQQLEHETSTRKSSK